MNAAIAQPVDLTRAPVLALAIPAELEVVFEESPRTRSSFWALDPRDRRGFLRYIEESKTPTIRGRRAALIGMSLLGLSQR